MEAGSAIAPEYIAARRALLDALDALTAHRNALVLVGAQAVYEHAPAGVEMAPSTTDSDIAVDPDLLATAPEIAELLGRGSFTSGANPGTWVSHDGVGIDLMVPASIEASRSRHAKLTGHSPKSARRTAGIEVCLVDHSPVTLKALDSSDSRTATVNVAGPAALAVAKLVKLQERLEAGKADRVLPKDASDLLRLLRSCGAEAMGTRLAELSALRGIAEVVDPVLAWFASELSSPRSRLVELAVDSLAGFESRSQVVDSLQTLGQRMIESHRS